MNNKGNIKQEGSLINKYYKGGLNDSEINELVHSQVLKLFNASKKSHNHISHIPDEKLRKDLETSLSNWEDKELKPKLITTEKIEDPILYYPKNLREWEYSKYIHEWEKFFIEQKKDI